MSAAAAPPPFPSLLELDPEELAARLGSRRRALTVRRWLFAGRPALRALPAAVPGVSRAAFAALAATTSWPSGEVLSTRRAGDGTTGLVLDLDGAEVECVLIPSSRRSTVCLSSQAGCTRSCAFCATATLGFRRNLTAGEMLVQFLAASALAGADGPVRNVVFMGMGEPMDNLDAVLCAVARLTDPGAPGLAASRITVSTSGVLPGMERFLAESRANLALSLNATTDTLRARLMPHARTWPIADLLGLLRRARAADPGRDFFIEYVMMAGVNDSDADAARLSALLAGVAGRVNLIPHNGLPGSRFAAPDEERVRAFAAILHRAGLRPLARGARGGKVRAACGQLALGG